MEEVGLFDAIHTTRAIRRFRPDPVPDDLIRKLVDAAVRGPSGGNRQPWLFVVVRDRRLKEAVAPFYLRAWEETYGPGTPNRASAGARVVKEADYFAAHVAETPVLIFPCADHARTGSYTPGQPLQANRYASSVFPAVQNLLLAARGLGLGAALTTVYRRYEDEVRRALGLPASVETYAMVPVGYPADGVKFGPTRRPPAEQFIHWA